MWYNISLVHQRKHRYQWKDVGIETPSVHGHISKDLVVLYPWKNILWFFCSSTWSRWFYIQYSTVYCTRPHFPTINHSQLWDMAMGQNPGSLVSIKIDGIYGCEYPPKYGTMGFDTWPYVSTLQSISNSNSAPKKNPVQVTAESLGPWLLAFCCPELPGTSLAECKEDFTEKPWFFLKLVS